MVTFSHIWELIELLPHAEPINEPIENHDDLHKFQIAIVNQNDWEAVRNLLKNFSRCIVQYNIVSREKDTYCSFYFQGSADLLEQNYLREWSRLNRRRR